MPNAADTLIVYASNSGNTRYAAERIAEVLQQQGRSVVVRDVAGMKPHELRGYPVVVFGSCTWERRTPEGKLEGQLPEHMHRFAGSAEHTKLPGARFAVFALGRHEYTAFAGAANHLQVLVQRLGGELLLPPLKYDGFPQQDPAPIDAWAAELAVTIPERSAAR